MQLKLNRVLAVFAVTLLVGLAIGWQRNARAEFPGANGKIAYYGSGPNGFDVFTYSNGTTTNLTNNPSFTISADAAWSPDGTKIAFDNQGAIAVMNADGSNRHELTPELFNIEPDWSPDGTKIVFASSDGDISVMNSDGTGLMDITNTFGASEEDPSWSPDGSKIAFSSSRDENWEIYVANPDGTSPENRTNNSANDRDPDWSPDSSKLVFSRDGAGIYTMNANGGPQTQIATSGDAPVWSPDSTKILFVRNFSEIATMNTNGSGQTLVTYGYHPSWQSSPSGTINGTLYESPSGYFRGISVTLHPPELKATTSVTDGSFSFNNVPFGNYTLTVSTCSYYGCYATTNVTLSSAKSYVAIYPTAFTPTPTPPPAVGGLTQLADVTANDGPAAPRLAIAIACGLAIVGGLGAGWALRRR